MCDQLISDIPLPTGWAKSVKAAVLHVISVAQFALTYTPAGRPTSEERSRRIPAACRRPRFEPRPHWPVGSGCASPTAKVRGQPSVRLRLVLEYYEGRKHLPIATLKRAA